jgi:Lrp/AsnC family transcriptional regulator for asnA, asnC and gidA
MEDARMPAAHIARRLGSITPRVVSDRIDSLVREGVICITAIINPEKAGFPVRADMYIEVESTHILEVAQKLAGMEQTTWVACAIGESDLGVQICVRENKELYRFVTEVIHSVPAIGESDLGVQICVRENKELYRFVTEVIHNVPGITRTATTLVSQILKDRYDWCIPDSVSGHRG